MGLFDLLSVVVGAATHKEELTEIMWEGFYRHRVEEFRETSNPEGVVESLNHKGGEDDPYDEKDMVYIRAALTVADEMGGFSKRTQVLKAMKKEGFDISQWE